MNGTDWTDPGQGATVDEIERAILDAGFIHSTINPRRAEDSCNAFRHATRATTDGIRGHSNLRLTGAPLNEYDIRRIEQCKVEPIAGAGEAHA